MAHSVFWLDEWIVNSHDVDLAMLHPVVAVSISWEQSPETSPDDLENRRIAEDLNHKVSRGFFLVKILEDVQLGATHKTTDTAETIDADLGNHG